MKPNPGHCPHEAVGKRVRVRLVGEDAAPAHRSWPADGRGGCDWTRSTEPFAIAEYEVIQ